jgi:Flp pilus assembly protein TadB
MSPAEEAHENAEHAEHAKEPFDKKVAATMAIIAAALAVVSVLGHISTTEELLSQQKASDQWSYYQAKSIRRYESEIARDLMAELKGGKVKDYSTNIEKYKKDGEEIQTQARELEEESHRKGREALRYHFGEVFLEIAIVFASLAILTKRPLLWFTSIAGATLGVALALTAPAWGSLFNSVGK